MTNDILASIAGFMFGFQIPDFLMVLSPTPRRINGLQNLWCAAAGAIVGYLLMQ